MAASYLSDSDINTVIRLAPLVSIDLIIRDPTDRILLGLRNNEPAKGYFFVPGGIILKDETLAEAFARIMKKEINRPGMLGHSEVGWWTEDDLLNSDRVHESTKAYFR